MKVGIDVSNLLAGGGRTHLRALLSESDPREYGINKVIVWGSKTTLEQLPQQPWLEPIHIPTLDISFVHRAIWRLHHLSEEVNRTCDVLFVPGGTYIGSSRPYVTMFRNMLPFDLQEVRRYGFSWMIPKFLLLRRWQTVTMQKANGVIFLSEYARKMAQRVTGPLSGAVALIPHGVAEEFRQAPRPIRLRAQFTAINPLRILYVSSITVYKHQPAVAAAVMQLAEEGIPVQLYLVGPRDKPAYRHLQKVLRRIDPDGNVVHYLGTIPHQNLAELYATADIFVYASSCENLPNILFEAMAAGLPIACSDRGPMPEILLDAGVYFDPERVETIKSSLLQLIESRELRFQCAWKAYELSKSFSWKECASQTFQFIRHVTENSLTS